MGEEESLLMHMHQISPSAPMSSPAATESAEGVLTDARAGNVLGVVEPMVGNGLEGKRVACRVQSIIIEVWHSIPIAYS